MRCVTALAPAKLNLTLDVTGVRPDGYHTVDMLMQTVDLYERVIVRKSAGLTLTLPGSAVPANEHNTAWKAAVAFFRETGLLAGASVTVEKRVPVRAGMAGGSADAAAVLVALNALYGARLSERKLCALGARVGADVPFCVMGGTARVTGIGEALERVPPCPPCFFTVCMPRGGSATPQVYARYDCVGAGERPDTPAALAALAAGDLPALCAQMKNALSRAGAGPDTEAIRRVLREYGAGAALMTGSGAAVFGVFRAQSAAEAARDALAADYPGAWVLRPAPRGAHVVHSL